MKIAILTTDNRENFRSYNIAIPYFGTAPEALLQGFTMHPEVEIHVVSCSQQPMASPEKLANNIWFHSLHVPKIGWLRTGYQGCVRAVRRKLKEIQPDIVHGQGTERDCAISAVLSDYPNILTLHGNMRQIAKLNSAKLFSYHWLTSYLEAWTIYKSVGVVAITSYTRDAVKDLSKQFWVIPNAVDVLFLEVGKNRIFKISEEYSSSPIVLVVANISRLKNQNEFIRALDPLVDNKEFQVRFFGACSDSEYSREFHKMISERHWCHYGGMIGREELREEFKLASMLALPTLEDNCPMVVLEAMAAGVPVMASKVGGVPDLIDGSSTGLFCDPQDPESFSIGVQRLLEDRDFAHQMAFTAFHEAMNRFHPKVIAERHLEIYREVLGQ